jgi:hypothetical protein
VRRHWLIPALVLTTAGCGLPPVEIAQTAEIERGRIRGDGTSVVLRGRDPQHLAVAVRVRNVTGADATLEELSATVVAADGTIPEIATLAASRVVSRDATAEFQGRVRGSWPEDSTLVLAIRLRTVDGIVHTSFSCHPLCPTCREEQDACRQALIAVSHR